MAEVSDYTDELRAMFAARCVPLTQCPHDVPLPPSPLSPLEDLEEDFSRVGYGPRALRVSARTVVQHTRATMGRRTPAARVRIIDALDRKALLWRLEQGGR